MDNFDDIYEEWVDNIISNPLTTSRLREFGDVIDINQRIVNHIYNIRRHLELNDIEIDDNERTNRSYNRFHPYRRVRQPNSNQGETFFEILRSSFGQGLFEMVLQETNNDTNTTFDDVKVTLDQEQFNKLKCDIVNHDNINEYKLRECNICIEDYKEGNEVIELPCKHYFHKECIKNWLCDEKVTCPVCRKDMREFL